MPYSSEAGKKFILEYVQKINPAKVLDIAAGSGTYSKLLRNPGSHWTAVEVWEPYVEKFNLGKLYDEVIVADAREWEIKEEYDLCILGDVLEHMTKEQAVALLAAVRAKCRHVVTSIPIGHYPQEEFEGNPFERHVTDNWTGQEIRDVFGDPYLMHVENEIAVCVYKKLKIAVYAISKNEAMFVERFCDSAKEADMVLIADTGSTDNTAELARQHGATVHEICVSPWRFDIARDAALVLIPRDFDVCISLDLDEVLEPGWRQEIERVWTGDVTRLRYKFDWGSGISFYYEKIHHRQGYHWHHPCHEYPVADKRTKEVWAHTDMLLVSHHPDPTKSRGQYMDLLTVAVTEDPRCPRNAFYYARELTFNYRWQEALEALHKYLAMPEATWPNERCYAMRLISKSHQELGNPQEAIKWARLAAAEAPNTREPWVELSLLAYTQCLWPESYAGAMTALNITDKAAVYTMDPSVWTERPYDLASVAAWNLGLKEQAIQMCKKALEFAPDNERLKDNLKKMESP